ncbi:hypothetical protein DFP73DRAFT_556160 [Morchella snyderi]|nr:hypothetical protein DFP73DRAFT_556160 [Morchella snyderi]
MIVWAAISISISTSTSTSTSTSFATVYNITLHEIIASYLAASQLSIHVVTHSNICMYNLAGFYAITQNKTK